MARGPRKSYEDQLKNVEEQIERCTQRLNRLKEEKEAILSQKRQSELKELYQLLQEQNLSVEDAMRMISQKEIA